MFVDGRKILPISLLLFMDKVVTNVSEKTDIFIDYLSQQYQPLSNESILLLRPT